MLLLKYLMMIAGVGAYLAAAAVVVYDVYMAENHRRLLARGVEGITPTPKPIRWKAAKKLAMFAWLPLLMGLAIVVVPSGMAGVRVR